MTADSCAFAVAAFSTLSMHHPVRQPRGAADVEVTIDVVLDDVLL